VRGLLGGAPYRRLLAVRLTTQLGDGGFEVALASLFFFSPERATTAGGIALAFAVLTLPFTLVGPWAGVPLDRWSRRNTLVLGNLVRAALVLVVAALVAAGQDGPALYAVVLLCVSINRFLLAALSAGLPHVVEARALVTANALTPTLGTAAALVGSALVYAARLAGLSHAALLLVVAAALVAASLLGLRLGAGQLGPDRVLPAIPRSSRAVRPLPDAAADLTAALRHLRERRTAAAALGVMSAHRFIFGVSTLATILLARNYLSSASDADHGLVVLGWVVAAGAVGFVAAAVLTPAWVGAAGPARVIVVALVAAAVTEATFVLAMTPAQLLVGAALIGWAGQTVKICVDTIVQRDVDDAFRGRVFSLYDVAYNAAFVSAAALSALVVPDSGYSRVVYAVLAAGYLAAGVVFGRSRGSRVVTAS
jgi:MFS family permease